MGTRGTLIIGREGEVLLFGDDDKPAELEAKATSFDVTPKSAGAVLEASESRLADA